MASFGASSQLSALESTGTNRQLSMSDLGSQDISRGMEVRALGRVVVDGRQNVKFTRTNGSAEALGRAVATSRTQSNASRARKSRERQASTTSGLSADSRFLTLRTVSGLSGDLSVDGFQPPWISKNKSTRSEKSEPNIENNRKQQSEKHPCSQQPEGLEPNAKMIICPDDYVVNQGESDSPESGHVQLIQPSDVQLSIARDTSYDELPRSSLVQNHVMTSKDNENDFPVSESQAISEALHFPVTAEELVDEFVWDLTDQARRKLERKWAPVFALMEYPVRYNVAYLSTLTALLLVALAYATKSRTLFIVAVLLWGFFNSAVQGCQMQLSSALSSVEGADEFNMGLALSGVVVVPFQVCNDSCLYEYTIM